MHISSLPGPFGIGVFGEEAIAFAKQLAGQGMKYWQVLPFSLFAEQMEDRLRLPEDLERRDAQEGF